MSIAFSQRARVLAGIISLAAFIGLAVQSTLNLERDGSPLVSFALLLRFFTIWSNLAAAVLFAWIAAKGSIHRAVPFALATAITIVAIVYHTLLAADHYPVGLDWYTNQMHHTIIPAATVGWWLAFTRPVNNGWKDLPLVMIAPVAYTVFALVYGEMSGFYAYFFLDVPQYGYGRVFANIAGLALVFMLFGALLLGLRRLVSARA
ncbi:Pr6Pr family membrane protein [Qipengyuania gaetbuli]|uniref:Pr6Pr family membrane protein n=1 Tax=Qipengyuania gaetbuli TaxID=266952 RepID=UPI001CD3FDF9|nr:Pr6Pr family membrane protein [Qipengyuania gaetbuli]MCA0910434.1 Pr6Pr family membrane protein [Qipengyuania gaetbuli]